MPLGFIALQHVSTVSSALGEQDWHSGESARLPPMCPGFDSRTRRHMWAEFVGSLLCSERFFFLLMLLITFTIYFGVLSRDNTQMVNTLTCFVHFCSDYRMRLFLFQ